MLSAWAETTIWLVPLCISVQARPSCTRVTSSTGASSTTFTTAWPTTTSTTCGMAVTPTAKASGPPRCASTTVRSMPYSLPTTNARPSSIRRRTSRKAPGSGTPSMTVPSTMPACSSTTDTPTWYGATATYASPNWNPTLAPLRKGASTNRSSTPRVKEWG